MNLCGQQYLRIPLPESTISGSHDYEKVTVDAACGRDAYTENRCKDCGVTEAGTREYIEGTAEDHHYVHFDETYYTKDSDGNWNTNDCYVCTFLWICSRTR